MPEKQEKKVSYKNTLNLPRTDFPIRSNPKVDDALILERWQQDDLYRKSFFAHEGHTKFILHDGPPYANGNLHLGHALNKVLKDIAGKSQRMMGKQVPITPGWDCHGLPIELKVSKEHPNLDRTAFKKECRAYAQKWVDIQKEEFKQLGVLMDWENPYLTMHFSYESSILKALGIFIDKGYIERKNKTVPWCPSCQTVLASAEIEYADRKDPSVYTLFTLTKDAVKTIAPELQDKEVHLLVWTTTPWTLPLNRAVLLKPSAEYVVLDVDGQYIVTARQLADNIAALKDVPKKVIATFNSAIIPSGKLKAQHPFITNFEVPIILDGSVSLEDGTAAVHSAPGCGPEDYEVGVKNNLEIFSPITSDGKYTSDIKPKELDGMLVADGQWWVLRKLDEVGKLFHKTNIKHSYPHCWRCRGGLIFRATKQWFCDLSKHDLKSRVINAIDTKIETIPKKSINRLKATVEGRLEWCLSRQRVWGVPIPAIIHDKTDYVYTSKELIDTVAHHVAQEGVEWWDNATIKDLLPKDFDFNTYPLDELRKEQDILDVWFDSGVSYFAVLMQREELGFPADLYLEGKDQHRGWFQSSLLSSMITQDVPPMKTVMTHGFTVDEKGRKMSKSIGNVVAPDEMIQKLGTDGLRLWVSSIDESGEAVVSDVLMANVKEVFRKIRNTARFLISNLYDFDIEKDAVPLNKLTEIDVHGLQELYTLNHKVLKAYNDMDFTAVFHTLGDYTSVDLSSFYLDIIKDRLYVEKADGHKRRSAQTACWYILDTLTRLMAPILSFTAEQLSDNYQKNKNESIHLQQFTALSCLNPLFDVVETEEPDELCVNECQSIDINKKMAEQEQLWTVLKNMRSAMLKSIEQLREKGIIKHSLEAHISIYLDRDQLGFNVLDDFKKQLERKNQTLQDFFREFLIVSQFDIVDTKNDLAPSIFEGLSIKVEQAKGEKCPRCWQWQKSSHVDNLCDRCEKII
jgi:isoleucyl-tRNA synthetase